MRRAVPIVCLSIYYCRTTEDSVETGEPLLKLEIRPNRLWINEVREAIAHPEKVEKA